MYMTATTYLVIKLQMCVYWLQVIAYHKAVASAQQNAAENQSTGQYASPKEKVDKNKEHEVLHAYECMNIHEGLTIALQYHRCM